MHGLWNTNRLFIRSFVRSLASLACINAAPWSYTKNEETKTSLHILPQNRSFQYGKVTRLRFQEHVRLMILWLMILWWKWSHSQLDAVDSGHTVDFSLPLVYSGLLGGGGMSAGSCWDCAARSLSRSIVLLEGGPFSSYWTDSWHVMLHAKWDNDRIWECWSTTPNAPGGHFVSLWENGRMVVLYAESGIENLGFTVQILNISQKIGCEFCWNYTTLISINY